MYTWDAVRFYGYEIDSIGVASYVYENWFLETTCGYSPNLLGKVACSFRFVRMRLRWNESLVTRTRGKCIRYRIKLQNSRYVYVKKFVSRYAPIAMADKEICVAYWEAVGHGVIIKFFLYFIDYYTFRKIFFSFVKKSKTMLHYKKFLRVNHGK